MFNKKEKGVTREEFEELNKRFDFLRKRVEELNKKIREISLENEQLTLQLSRQNSEYAKAISKFENRFLEEKVNENDIIESMNTEKCEENHSNNLLIKTTLGTKLIKKLELNGIYSIEKIIETDRTNPKFWEKTKSEQNDSFYKSPLWLDDSNYFFSRKELNSLYYFMVSNYGYFLSFSSSSSSYIINIETRQKILEDDFEKNYKQFPESFGFSEEIRSILNEKLRLFESKGWTVKGKLNTRAINALCRSGIRTVAGVIVYDLASNNGNEWYKIHNLGNQSKFELYCFMKDYGYSLSIETGDFLERYTQLRCLEK